MSKQISPDDCISEVRDIMEKLASTEDFFERMFYPCLGCPSSHSDTVAHCAVECGYPVGKAVRLLNQCLLLLELSADLCSEER